MMQKIESRLNELCTHMLFEYKGITCGIDPISHSCFDMWCGDNDYTASNIDEVMTKPFFNGKSLNEIADEIEIIEW